MNNPNQLSTTSTEEVATPPPLPDATLDAAAESDVHPMELLLRQDTFNFRELEPGETIEGEIVDMRENDILVNIGSKSEGVIPARDLDRVDAEIRQNLKIGSKIFIQVVRSENREGHVTLSLSRALQEFDWKRAEELMSTQDVFEGEVNGFNKGGVIVFIGKARGFVPASQLVSDEGRKRDDTDDRFAELVGKTLQLKVIEIDRARNRLILSERQAMRDWRRARKEELLLNLEVGDVREGVVSSLASFGAFVDLGGADGLIHMSELSWGRVQDPSEVVQLNQKVRVKVISVDRDRRRIGLSLRQTQPEPWSVVHEKYAIGQLVEGTVTRLTSFGAFARVEGIIEGLIHISELSEQRIGHPKEVLREGDQLTLRIIKIDPDKRRMGLSLRRVAEEEYAVVDWAAEEGDESEEEEEVPTSMAAAMADAEEAMYEDEEDEEAEEEAHVIPVPGSELEEAFAQNLPAVEVEAVAER